MDDMNAFERQLSGEISGLMGPVRPVDDLAIFESVTAASRPTRWGFTMFSALEFVGAAAIVALFGGFLLTGILSTPQDGEVLPAAVSASPEPESTSKPTAAPTDLVRSDLLPGVELTVEEVEPGVFHVLNDGVRDLVLGGNTDIVAGHDDGIWLLRKDQFVRLGSEAGQAWPEAVSPDHADFEVTPEGTVWVIKSGVPGTGFLSGPLFSSDGDGWTRTRSPSDSVRAIAVAPDGTLWASWTGGGFSGVGHLGPSGWLPLDSQGQWGSSVVHLYPTDSGDLYAEECPMGCSWFSRYEDGAWDQFVGAATVGLFDVAPDGTVWFLGPLGEFSADAANDGLARFVDGAWERWGPDDLPDMGLGLALDAYGLGAVDTFSGAPDGSLWASLWKGSDADDAPERGLWGPDERRDAVEHGRAVCDGLVRFDGTTADRFLPDRCVTMDIAADGSIWVLTDEDNGKDLYVITLEAVSASIPETGQQKEG